ncbi:hypothetical protein PRIEUP_LOCUS735, partial [Pristimantis euphronides]
GAGTSAGRLTGEEWPVAQEPLSAAPGLGVTRHAVSPSPLLHPDVCSCTQVGPGEVKQVSDQGLGGDAVRIRSPADAALPQSFSLAIQAQSVRAECTRFTTCNAHLPLVLPRKETIMTPGCTPVPSVPPGSFDVSAMGGLLPIAVLSPSQNGGVLEVSGTRVRSPLPSLPLIGDTGGRAPKSGSPVLPLHVCGPLGREGSRCSPGGSMYPPAHLELEPDVSEISIEGACNLGGMSHISPSAQDVNAKSFTNCSASDSGSPLQLPQSLVYSGNKAQWDWQSHLRSLPTKTEMDNLLQRIVILHKKDISDLKHEIQIIGQRLSAVEQHNSQLINQLETYRAVINAQIEQITNILTHTDDLENRHRRNNLHIRGVPEDIDHLSLEKWAVKFFGVLLHRPPDRPVLIDRMHRSSGLYKGDMGRPRDVICCMHYYKEKEAIIRAAWRENLQTSQSFPIKVLSDLSKRTLNLRRALKPLLLELKNRNIPYRWGYPFQFSVRRDGKTVFFKQIEDLPHFLDFFRYSHDLITGLACFNGP